MNIRIIKRAVNDEKVKWTIWRCKQTVPLYKRQKIHGPNVSFSKTEWGSECIIYSCMIYYQEALVWAMTQQYKTRPVSCHILHKTQRTKKSLCTHRLLMHPKKNYAKTHTNLWFTSMARLSRKVNIYTVWSAATKLWPQYIMYRLYENLLRATCYDIFYILCQRGIWG